MVVRLAAAGTTVFAERAEGATGFLGLEGIGEKNGKKKKY